jgi:hypothetical protein
MRKAPSYTSKPKLKTLKDRQRLKLDEPLPIDRPVSFSRMQRNY